jgi:hypothetical protein
MKSYLPLALVHLPGNLDQIHTVHPDLGQGRVLLDEVLKIFYPHFFSLKKGDQTWDFFSMINMIRVEVLTPYVFMK